MRSIAALAKKYRWPLTGALLGALVFVVLYGVRVLDPACVDWILNDPSPDPSQHYLGWVFYRRSAVRLPYIGANYSAVYPFRTSIVFTDSIPLLAVLGKLLGPLLPARFQYFGWWGLLCYALQGGLAQAILARLGGVRSGQRARCWATVAGAGVLVFFPALTVRMFAHTALAANWLVLLALWLLLRSDALLPSTGRACLAWGMMGLLCAGVHLYYLPMVGIVLVGYALRRGLQKRGAAAVAAPVLAYCGAALAELVLLGAFAANFAGYSNGYLNGADLANLFVSGLNASWEQDVYIGLGGVLACVLAAAAVLLACVLLLRLWGGRAAAALLAACTLAQAYGMREELGNRYTKYHAAATYAGSTALQDPVWEELADGGRFRHLAFASFDFEHEEFWDLAAFAADHGWTSNSFYMGHMDGNLAAVTLAGEMNGLSADTLYVFVDEDELARDNFALHYYRFDGILVGSVEPLPYAEEPAPAADARAMDLTLSSVTNGSLTGEGITLESGGEMLTGAWMLFPGTYQVTLTGSGFDHSYIYARHGLINQETYKLEVAFTDIAPEQMTFTFTTGAPLYYWRTAVHTLDDTPVTVSGITVEKTA